MSVLALLLLALLVLGLAGRRASDGAALVFDQLHYGGQLPFEIAPGVSGSLFLHADWRVGCSLPLRCQVRDVPPYALKLQLADPSLAALRLTLSEIRVAQAGQPPRRLTGDWSWPLRQVTRYQTGAGDGAVPEMAMEAVIPAVVTEPADVALTLSGWLEHRGGAVMPFRITQRFAIRARRSSYSLGEVIEAIMSGA